MPAIIKCQWLDYVCAPCGQDPDEMLAFQTTKAVRINDRVLGSFSLIVTITIFFYIVYDLCINQGWLIIEKPTGTTKLSVLLPPFADADPAFVQPGCSAATPRPGRPNRCCTDCPAVWPKSLVALRNDGDLPYCSATTGSDPTCPNCPTRDGNGYQQGIKMPCLFWDNYQYVVPSIGRQALITTRVKSYSAELPCNRDYDKGKTAVSSFRAPDLDCIQGLRQYPLLDERFTGFVAGVESATVKIDHTVSGIERGLEKRLTDMHGVLKGCNGSVLKQMPPWDQTEDSLDIDRVKNRLFPLKLILAAARAGGGGGVNEFGVPDPNAKKPRCGVDLDQPSLLATAGDKLKSCREKVQEMAEGKRAPLSVTDCGSTVRYDGLVVLITINYDNTLDDPDSLDQPSYEITVNALSRTEAEIERVGFVAKLPNGTDVVQYEKRQGILLMVQQTGRLGTFSFKATLINLTAALTLLAVANTITVFIAKFVCPRITGDKRYYDLLIQESPDFNEEAVACGEVKAKQSAPDGKFVEGDIGNARWDKDGDTVEIKWLKGPGGSPKSCTHTCWPNAAWYEEIKEIPPRTIEAKPPSFAQPADQEMSASLIGSADKQPSRMDSMGNAGPTKPTRMDSHATNPSFQDPGRSPRASARMGERAKI
eukprot:TRINITY_DN3911_c0_g1_i1.p1 TRINITY_DN3911_c0_g1~~TRINITY_DN3911_c0_g1_i1.p1  ORF type:complete len:675 (+),score=227.65 TRINITY_DN3911_c0_g1_i1:76-2025(+)